MKNKKSQTIYAINYVPKSNRQDYDELGLGSKDAYYRKKSDRDRDAKSLQKNGAKIVSRYSTRSNQKYNGVRTKNVGIFGITRYENQKIRSHSISGKKKLRSIS